MKFIKKIFRVIVLIVVTNVGVNAQSFDSLMYNAYLMNSHSLWESALNKTNNDPSLQKAVAYYGILNNTMVSSNAEVFDHYVDPALEFLESMEDNGVSTAEAMALRSSIYGFIMAYSPWKGMYYGPKSGSAMDDALNANAQSPIVNMIHGSSLYYTPESFGGDKDAAIKAFEKAVILYEKEEYKGWLYLNTLANLGQAYVALGRKAEAIATYEKALAVEPDFKWVSNQLLVKAKNP